jgi:hypothetical protein
LWLLLRAAHKQKIEIERQLALKETTMEIAELCLRYAREHGHFPRDVCELERAGYYSVRSESDGGVFVYGERGSRIDWRYLGRIKLHFPDDESASANETMIEVVGESGEWLQKLNRELHNRIEKEIRAAPRSP